MTQILPPLSPLPQPRQAAPYRIFRSGFLLGFMLLACLAQAQRAPEYLGVQFDKPFYVAGEDLWYTVYFTQPKLQQSNVVYTELIGPDGTHVSDEMLRAQDGFAFGDMALPPDLPQGYYLFRAYTAWNLNFEPQEIYSLKVPIYRADQPLMPSDSLPDLGPALASGVEGITIGLSQTEAAPRDSLSVQLATLGAGGTVSLSVMDTRYLAKGTRQLVLTERVNALGNNTPPALVQGRDLIEPEKQHTQTFILKNPETGEFVNSNFIMGFIKQTQQKLLRKAENGIVEFAFEDFYDSTIVQFFDANPFEHTYIPEVSDISSFYSVRPPDIQPEEPPLTPEVSRYLATYRKRYQLHRLFGTQANMRAGKVDDQPSKYTPTSSFLTDDFMALENLEDFFKNAVPPVKIKKGKKANPARRFDLYVPHKGFKNPRIVQKPPVLLVNEYFTYDAEAVLSIDLETVRQIDVFNDVRTLPAQFGPIGDFGVVAIYTRDGKTPEEIQQTANNLRVSGFYLPREFEGLNLELDTKGSHIPDFRPMMYWAPTVHLVPGTQSERSFQVGDQPGTYLIHVEGILEDGTPVHGEKLLEVRLDP